MSRRLLVGSLVLLFLLASVGGIAFAQQQQRQRDSRNRRNAPMPDTSVDRNGVPLWEVPPAFRSDVFTFVRVRNNSNYRSRSWMTDYPDSDLNFSFRLQQLTSLKVDPKGKVLELTDEALFDYPFLYMLEVGSLEFSEAEVLALRRYLSNGGFLMVDDFWGEDEWENFREQMKRVFPDRDAVDLPLEHPIFHTVYDLKQKPQIPGIDVARRMRGTNVTWERYDAREVHYRGLFDDMGRMMAIICHNTDNGDAWEREGEEEWYFREFSEKFAYPMGINIVMYAMTH